MQFDLRAIPVTSTIEKAVLELTMYRNEVKDKPVTISLHRLLDSWHQFSVTWASQPPANSNPDATITIENTTPLGKIYIDITELVKGWYDGSIPNNGLLLKGNEKMNDLIAFRSTRFG
ncbi:MAG: DNRLRE domain-containing protein, partial [Syntrophomonadaceae bacterium]|nr:DNRLRE domain-containing protein [Syntrophomonadaceae bacterium]